MTTVAVQLPDAIFAALRRSPSEVADELRLAAAIHWYQQGTLSMERAAEIAGLHRVDFLAELARRRIDVFVVESAALKRELSLG